MVKFPALEPEFRTAFDAPRVMLPVLLGVALQTGHACGFVSAGFRSTTHISLGIGPIAPTLTRHATMEREPLRMQLETVSGHQMPCQVTGLERLCDAFSTLFPLWILAVTLVGLYTPAVFAGISTSYYTGLLGLLTFLMGTTLCIDDFKQVLTRPGEVVFGFLMCYALMPVVAFVLSKLLQLPAALTSGMVLAGSINGGQVANLRAAVTTDPCSRSQK